MRAPVARSRKALRLLVAITIATSAAGCTAGATQDSGQGPASAPPEPSPQVIHLVTVTEGRAPDPGEAAAEPWKVRTERERWILVGGGTYRTQEAYALVPGDVHESPLTTELVKDGVRTTLQVDLSQSEGSLDPSHASQRDVEEEIEQLLLYSSEPLLAGDSEVYRKALDSGDAVLLEDSPEKDTLRIALESPTPYGPSTGVTVTVDVRRSDYMPVRFLHETWRVDTDLGPGRFVHRRSVTEYEVAEVIPLDQAPPGIFELDMPPDLSVTVERHLSIEESREMTEPVVHWAGNRFDGFERVADPMLLAGVWRHDHPDGDSVRGADMARPLVGQAEREVFVHYEGPDGADIKVSSIPATDSPQALGYYEADGLLEHITIGDRDATLLTLWASWTENSYQISPVPLKSPPAQVEPMHYLVMDLPGATVVVQGWKVDLDGLERVAESVRPLWKKSVPKDSSREGR